MTTTVRGVCGFGILLRSESCSELREYCVLSYVIKLVLCNRILFKARVIP